MATSFLHRLARGEEFVEELRWHPGMCFVFGDHLCRALLDGGPNKLADRFAEQRGGALDRGLRLWFDPEIHSCCGSHNTPPSYTQMY